MLTVSKQFYLKIANSILLGDFKIENEKKTN